MMIDQIDASQHLIMVVDDNKINLYILKHVLENEGFNVITAINGQEAITKAKEFYPDLIALDICMPEKGGLDVCREIRLDKQLSDIPIIFVTADTTDEILMEAFDSGGTDYIRKPVNKTEVIARVRSMLTRRLLLQHKIQNEKLKAILEMAGAMCHEMSQPLQAIYGYWDLMKMSKANNQKFIEFQIKIQHNLERIKDIQDKLRKIVRYETKEYLRGKIIDIEKCADLNPGEREDLRTKTADIAH